MRNCTLYSSMLMITLCFQKFSFFNLSWWLGLFVFQTFSLIYKHLLSYSCFRILRIWWILKMNWLSNHIFNLFIIKRIIKARKRTLRWIHIFIKSMLAHRWFFYFELSNFSSVWRSLMPIFLFNSFFWIEVFFYFNILQLYFIFI